MHVRSMRAGDAEAVAAIYNDGIRGRGATFRTRERSAAELASWVDDAARHPVVVAEQGSAIVGWARAGPYSDFEPYAGVGEVAVYVADGARGGGVGGVLVDALCDACRASGYWKLVAKVFPQNEASIRVLHRCGFRDVGTHHRHGRLDGAWRDVLLLERSL